MESERGPAERNMEHETSQTTGFRPFGERGQGMKTFVWKTSGTSIS